MLSSSKLTFMRNATLILSLFCLVFTACNDKAVECIDVPDSLQVKIKNGETKTIYECNGKEMKLSFVKVDDDSRCPHGVNCVWAGTAHITLNFNNSADNFIIELKKEHAVDYLGTNYSILFEELSPYPAIDSTILPHWYEATLKFTKK